MFDQKSILIRGDPDLITCAVCPALLKAGILFHYDGQGALFLTKDDYQFLRTYRAEAHPKNKTAASLDLASHLIRTRFQVRFREVPRKA